MKEFVDKFKHFLKQFAILIFISCDYINAIYRFIVTFIVRCKSREVKKVVSALHFQLLLSETRTYLSHLCFYGFILNLTAKEGFVARRID